MPWPAPAQRPHSHNQHTCSWLSTHVYTYSGHEPNKPQDVCCQPSSPRQLSMSQWRQNKDSSKRNARHHASTVMTRGSMRTCARLPDQLRMLTCDECCFPGELEPLQDCVSLVATQHSITSRGTNRPAQQTGGSTTASSSCCMMQLQAAAA
jgi:hypothetical protein